ncbi:helix-turn-helix transcriptional regulator [Paraglaciecola sp.]|uniref:helix-turn-helix transcriptional regulator n=1 Tax=Paraglaciecola sp. TaxID=1920173 RepID=UPI003EFA195C
MSHLYFILYALSLLSGVALISVIYPLYKGTRGFTETLAIYLIISFFVLFGSVSLYVSTNIVSGADVVQVFISGALCIIGLLSYLQPRQTYLSLGLEFTQSLHFKLLLAALSGPTACIALWQFPAEYFVYILTFPISIFTICVVYCQKLRWQHTSKKLTLHRMLSILIPIIAIIMALIEGAFFGQTIVERGGTLSLPLIYIAINLLLWMWRDDFFGLTLQQKIDPEKSTPTISGTKLDSLTAKEQEIVKAVKAGYSNKEIAAQLNISPSTVKNHLYNIFKKLEVTNRIALLATLSS